MLHEFLNANRAELIERCTLKVAQRPAPRPTDEELKYGIPLFLDQLIETLRLERMADPVRNHEVSGDPDGGFAPSEINTAAARHGLELLQHGFTVDQVVHDYGDLCQAVTDLAFERVLPIEVDEFRTLNRCLDDAIAEAVTEFSNQRDLLTTEKDTQALNERLGFLAHELRSLVQTATLAVTAIKTGNVGLAGATGGVLDRSLIGLRNLIDRSLADVRVMAGMPARRVLISMPELIRDVQISASLEARARGCRFAVTAAGLGLAVSADREMLSAAVGNLLQNAFKFTERETEVSLNVRASGERVLIEVSDHCGGLPSADAERMLRPQAQNSEGKSSLGLGLSICRNSVMANNGVLSVRNLPGMGCVFMIDLPRA
ncbi:MAG TPA: HAMP domain-containing sensor histidine kinase [Burkholderiales bacterium]|nr:HAMP domain-containing sensor histidine kinase [Burkholderiales bacterium]